MSGDEDILLVHTNTPPKSNRQGSDETFSKLQEVDLRQAALGHKH